MKERPRLSRDRRRWRSQRKTAEDVRQRNGRVQVRIAWPQQPNLSFFAFTATPKGKTLELFGRKHAPDLGPVPFHLYSMRQAIEEGFILDVLQHYIDYDAYFKLVKDAEDDPELPKRRTSTAIAKFAHLHEHNIAQKTEVIVEHFRNYVRFLMGGRAKAMVVTSSRLHAVRYMKAFERVHRRPGIR